MSSTELIKAVAEYGIDVPATSLLTNKVWLERFDFKKIDTSSIPEVIHNLKLYNKILLELKSDQIMAEETIEYITTGIEFYKQDIELVVSEIILYTIYAESPINVYKLEKFVKLVINNKDFQFLTSFNDCYHANIKFYNIVSNIIESRSGDLERYLTDSELEDMVLSWNRILGRDKEFSSNNPECAFIIKSYGLLKSVFRDSSD